MLHKTPNQLEVGMTLAADVINLDGKVLYETGMSLTLRHIEVLFMWGVSQIEVEGENVEEPLIGLEQFDSGTVETAKAAIARHFRLTKSSHPAVDTIKAMSVLKLAKQLLRTNSQ